MLYQSTGRQLGASLLLVLKSGLLFYSRSVDPFQNERACGDSGGVAGVSASVSGCIRDFRNMVFPKHLQKKIYEPCKNEDDACMTSAG